MDDLQTSQQRAGEHHKPEGNTSPAAPAAQYGNEPTGAPGPVTQPIKGEITQIDALATSQQKRGEFSLPES